MIYRIVRLYIKLALLIVLFFGSSGFAQTNMDIPPGFERIEEQPNLSINSIFFNQNMEKLIPENIDNRFFIIHFWSTWCMECVAEMIELEKLQKEFRKKPLMIIAASEDFKGIDTIDAFYKKHKIEYLDIYLDKKSKLFQGLMLNHLPVTYLIDFNGKVIARSTPGTPVDWNDAKLKEYFEEKLSKYQLLPPEYKKPRDEYIKPDPKGGKIPEPKKSDR